MGWFMKSVHRLARHAVFFQGTGFRTQPTTKELLHEPRIIYCKWQPACGTSMMEVTQMMLGTTEVLEVTQIILGRKPSLLAATEVLAVMEVTQIISGTAQSKLVPILSVPTWNS
jgi:hypothetical protein